MAQPATATAARPATSTASPTRATASTAYGTTAYGTTAYGTTAYGQASTAARPTTASPSQATVPENVRRAFSMFDTDRSGDIDSRELRSALTQLGMESDSQQARDVMRKYDTAGRGKLSLTNFNALVQDLLQFQRSTGQASSPTRAVAGQPVAAQPQAKGEVARLLLQPDVSNIFKNTYKGALDEIFNFYARLKGGAGGGPPTLELDELMHMLQDFKLTPTKLTREDARAAFKQSELATANALNRTEFDGCLLRLALAYATHQPDLSGPSVGASKKLFKFLATLQVGNIAAMRATFTDFRGEHRKASTTTHTKRHSQAAGDDLGFEQDVGGQPAAGHGSSRRGTTGVPKKGLVKAYREPKPLELTVHALKLYAHDPVDKHVQLGVQFGGLPLEMCPRARAYSSS